MLILLGLGIMMSASDGWAQRRKSRTPPPPKPVEIDYSTFNSLLPIYLDAKSAGRDYTAPLTGIVMDYAKMSPEQKKLYRIAVIDRGVQYMEAARYDEALAMGDLYKAFNTQPENPYASETFAFIRGVKAALLYGDSLTLKQEIAVIESLGNADKPSLRKARVATLNTYLQQIRDYIPPHNTLSGTWIADLCELSNGYPLVIMDIEQPDDPHKGKANFRLRHRHALELNYGHGSVFKDSTLLAQEVLSYAGDSIYCAWASESMRNPSPELNMLFRSTGMTFSNALSQKLIFECGNSFASSLMGGITGGILDAGVNALADAILNPSKKAIFLQMKMRKINDRLMEGDIYFSAMKVKSGAVQQRDSTVYHTLFTKVEPEDSLFFWNFGRLIPVTEGQQFTSRQIRGKYSWKHTPGFSVLAGADNLTFSKLQFAKQLYRTQQRMRDGNTARLINTSNVIGVNLPEKEIPADNGVVIGKPIKAFPAHLAGLKNGDCITHVDGFPVNSWEELKTMLQRCTPYEDIEITFVRGKKTKSITLQPVLPWQY